MLFYNVFSVCFWMIVSALLLGLLFAPIGAIEKALNRVPRAAATRQASKKYPWWAWVICLPFLMLAWMFGIPVGLGD